MQRQRENKKIVSRVTNMQQQYQLTLPYPPSMNTYWRNVPAGIYKGRSLRACTLLNAKARAYHEEVGYTLKRIPKLLSKLVLEIAVIKPDKRKRDLDNLLKPILDTLQKCGVYEDDSQVVDLRIYEHPTIKPSKNESKVLIIIKPIG